LIFLDSSFIIGLFVENDQWHDDALKLSRYIDTKDELVQWLRVFSMKPVIAIGTRSAVFAPVQRPGCIIIDDEQDYGYKQDQSPHYHSRTVAMMRCRIEHCDFVAGSPAPSLELMYEAQSGNIKFEAIPRSRPWPAIKIVDMKNCPSSKRQKITISGYLQNEVVASADGWSKKYCIFSTVKDMPRRQYAPIAQDRFSARAAA